MPIYEYDCKQCGIFEKIKAYTPDRIESCPICGRMSERIISNSSHKGFNACALKSERIFGHDLKGVKK